MLNTILDILAPSQCAVCGRPVRSAQCNLCSSCNDKIAMVEDSCPVCSGQLSEGQCGICSERAFYPTKNIAIAVYSGVMKELLHKFKFNGMRRLHVPIARLVINEISRNHARPDIITCVPMNGRKTWKRGFNQSELIARLVSKNLKMTFFRLLKESPRMAAQRELGQRHRFINIINRYSLRRGIIIKGKSILIIDDVFTTGATINECARVLRDAGAGEVYSITVARSNMKRLENSDF